VKLTQYTREEEDRLVSSLSEGGEPLCPRCGLVLGVQDVPEPEGVSYVRDRVWFTCDHCRRSIVLDRRRIEEGR
jgi:hypothetical protein